MRWDDWDLFNGGRVDEIRLITVEIVWYVYQGLLYYSVYFYVFLKFSLKKGGYQAVGI